MLKRTPVPRTDQQTRTPMPQRNPHRSIPPHCYVQAAVNVLRSYGLSNSAIREVCEAEYLLHGDQWPVQIVIKIPSDEPPVEQRLQADHSLKVLDSVLAEPQSPSDPAHR